MSGEIRFSIDDSIYDMTAGDVCFIENQHKFSYQNIYGTEAKLLIVHTPSFDMDAEVFE